MVTPERRLPVVLKIRWLVVAVVLGLGLGAVGTYHAHHHPNCGIFSCK